MRVVGAPSAIADIVFHVEARIAWIGLDTVQRDCRGNILPQVFHGKIAQGFVVVNANDVLTSLGLRQGEVGFAKRRCGGRRRPDQDFGVAAFRQVGQNLDVGGESVGQGAAIHIQQGPIGDLQTHGNIRSVCVLIGQSEDDVLLVLRNSESGDGIAIALVERASFGPGAGFVATFVITHEPHPVPRGGIGEDVTVGAFPGFHAVIRYLVPGKGPATELEPNMGSHCRNPW